MQEVFKFRVGHKRCVSVISAGGVIVVDKRYLCKILFMVNRN